MESYAVRKFLFSILSTTILSARLRQLRDYTQFARQPALLLFSLGMYDVSTLPAILSEEI